MKHFFSLTGLILLSVLFSCNKNENNPKDDDNQKDAISKINKVLLLKIDYTTYNLEGAKELVVSPEKLKLDSLPISIDYKLPGDFGSIFLYYQSKTDTVFFGTIHWTGEGEIYFPKNFNSLDDSPILDTEISLPAQSRFQLINSNLFYLSQIPVNYLSIWKAVSKLKIVDEYLSSNKKIGLFLYTSGVGVGNPAKWNWILILDN